MEVCTPLLDVSSVPSASVVVAAKVVAFVADVVVSLPFDGGSVAFTLVLFVAERVMFDVIVDALVVLLFALSDVEAFTDVVVLFEAVTVALSFWSASPEVKFAAWRLF